MCSRNKNVLQKISIFRCSTLDPYTAAVLLPVGIHRQPFNVTSMRQCNHHFFVSNKVFNLEFLDLTRNFGASLVAVFFFQRFELCSDNIRYQRFTRKDRSKFRDTVQNFSIFIVNALTFKSCQLSERHSENFS